MSDFKCRKIRNAPPRKPLSEKTKQNIATALGIVLLILVVYSAGLKIVQSLSGTRLVEVFSGIIGKDLAVDAENHTNILMLGVGGEGHEGKDLTDTIILASLDHNNNSAAFFSVPRDLYTETSIGESRINRLYEKGKLKWDSAQGLDFVRQTVEEMFALPIQYAVKVDFEAFEKVVDAAGGIDVYVAETINDPMYPKGETFEYETFFLPQGNQHLNGSTALKYVRSRKTSSDFDRSKRQQQVLIALKNKAESESLFGKKRLIQQLYSSLRDHVETNISLREMLSLAEFGSKIKSDSIAAATLNDEPIFKGGFLYTPLRELYGGAYVLLPASDNMDNVRKFAKLTLYGPKSAQSFPIAILNGTKKGGLASTLMSELNRFGVRTVATGNAINQDMAETIWYARDQEAASALTFLKDMVPGSSVSQFPAQYLQDPKLANARLIVELGKDSVAVIDKLNIFKNIVSLVPQNGSSTPK
ncbi:LCP family protein [Candidatus Peregrinibacteria bacterium]|nr:LCP family protein [Candidatus Peregrinibacteria bacterium]